MSVVIETTVGDITVDLYLKERPNTCLNFLKLCKIKYYNLCLFYKIEKNFIAQSGDPTATGRGGESIFCHLYGDQAKYFDAEFKPRLKHKKLGTLSMVNNGNNMNGSQFFLTLSENLTYLDEDHTVFGEVAEGFDVLLKLNDAICDNNNRPYQDIRITHTVVLHDPFEDPKGLEIPDASPEPTKEMLESNYIGADEEIDDNKGKTTAEIEEKIKESEAKARATILEMVGDIPDAEVKPPENVLFVCKLNPVTTSDDLEIIFSRFGKILSCEVIKDKKTGESLQYAFIEFEKEENCEAAYFKMDNVLIDDRRIHVDFSQSVSKLNFDKDGKYKPQSSKPAKSSISLKKTERSDGYELIFDMGDNASVSDGRRKEKSRASENETARKKHKHISQSENKDHRGKNEHYERRYADNKNDKYLHEKYKNSKYKEQDYKQTKSDKYGHEKDKSSKYREYDYKNTKSDKYGHDRNKSSKHRESDYRDTNDKHGYEKDRSNKYRENEYSRLIDKSRDSDQYLKSKNKYTSGESYRDSESYKKSSDSHSNEYKKSRKSRYDSMSPDRPKKSYGQYKEHSPSNSHSSKGKYSDKVDHYEYSTEGIKRKSSKSSQRNAPSKQKKSKRSSSSSSSSDSDSSSSSSSSSSASDYKAKEKSHHLKQKFSKSSSRPKNQKKRKYSK